MRIRTPAPPRARTPDGIAGSITIGVINYVLLGFQFPVDGFFMHAFEIWLATTVVFWGSGTVGYTLLEYRLGRRTLVGFVLFFVLWCFFFCSFDDLSFFLFSFDDFLLSFDDLGVLRV